MSPLAWLRIGGSVAVLVVLVGLGWKANGWRNEAAAAARLRSELAQVRKDNAEAVRRQREASDIDRSAALAAATEVQLVRDAYDLIRAMPRPVLVKEIPGEAGACPRPALADDFGVRFDLAASNPAPAGEDSPR